MVTSHGWLSRFHATMLDEAGDGLFNNALWQLEEPIFFQDTTGVLYEIPAGFVTDGSSVPRLPLVYFLFGCLAIRAGALHDYLIRTGERRDVADSVYLRALLHTKSVGGLRAVLMYLAVRLYSLILHLKKE